MTLLEDDVADLQDEVQEVETSNALQDDRLNIIDEAVNDNENEINGNKQCKSINVLFLSLVYTILCCYSMKYFDTI